MVWGEAFDSMIAMVGRAGLEERLDALVGMLGEDTLRDMFGRGGQKQKGGGRGRGHYGHEAMGGIKK